MVFVFFFFIYLILDGNFFFHFINIVNGWPIDNSPSVYVNEKEKWASEQVIVCIDVEPISTQ